MSDYIKIGDIGVIARNQISLVRRNSNFIEVMAAGLTNLVTFRFESADAAQKVLADVLRQLCRDSGSDSSGYRFFKSLCGSRYYAVPTSGAQSGRSFYMSNCGVVANGGCRWSLEEMEQDPADEEMTQQQFEAFAGTDWRNKL